MKTRHVLLCAVATSAVLFDAAAAFGQTTASPSPTQPTETAPPLEDIIVTARKRSENLQSVPATIAAVTGSTLASSGVRQLNQIASLTSGVTFVQVGGAQPLISMRGDFNRLGTTEPGTGVFVDGVYTTRFTQLGRGPFDVDRVEVVKGPQSTLYGRNTIAGAINIITAKPTFDWHGSVEAGYGGSSVDGDNLWHVQGFLSGPIVEDKVAFRIAGGHQERDGYLYDSTNHIRALGYDADFVRAELLITPSDGFRLTLSASHNSDNAPRGDVIRFAPGQSLVFAAPGAPVSQIPFFSNLHEYSSTIQPSTKTKSSSFTADARIDTGLGEVALIGNYQLSEFNQLTDFDATQIDVATQNFFDKSHAYSGEVRLSGKSDGWNWIGGLYYLDDIGTKFGQYIFFNPASVQRAVQGLAQQKADFPLNSRTFAAFGQVGYDITDKINILGGLRYASDRRSSPFSFSLINTSGNVAAGQIVDLPRSKTFTSVTGNVVATYKFTPQILAYASFATGNKAGGYSAAASPAAAAIPFGEQTVQAYEVGLKSEMFDRRLRLNIAAYYNRYSNLQVQRTITVGSAFFGITQNAASSRTPGVDVDAAFAFSRTVRLTASYSYQDAKITKYQIDPATLLTDIAVPRSPHHSGTVGVDWSDNVGPGKATLGADVNYKSSFTNDIAYSAATGVLTAPLPGYAVVNLRAAFAVKGWELSAYVRNLFDKNYAVSAFIANATAFQYWTPGEPRSFEFTLKRSF